MAERLLEGVLVGDGEEAAVDAQCYRFHADILDGRGE